MDRPSVNWKLVHLLQQEYSEQFGGAQIQIGLHTMHNSIKSGFGVWQVEIFWRPFTSFPPRLQFTDKVHKISSAFCGHC